MGCPFFGKKKQDEDPQEKIKRAFELAQGNEELQGFRREKLLTGGWESPCRGKACGTPDEV